MCKIYTFDGPVEWHILPMRQEGEDNKAKSVELLLWLTEWGLYKVTIILQPFSNWYFEINQCLNLVASI